MYGMTEEQFWKSNPRIIKVYEKAWREEESRRNGLIHAMIGSYELSALTTALSAVLTPMFCNGKRSPAKYIEEPIKIFPPTKEELEEEKKKAIQAFIAFAGSFEEKVKKNK